MTEAAAASSSSAESSSSGILDASRRELVALDTRKAALASEAEAIVSELTAELPDGGPPIGIDDPLVDSEGFPRADIDVYRARTLRRRFKEIQTDYRALERQIDAGLVEISALTSGGSRQKGGGGEGGIGSTTAREDEEEKNARLAPKPKPKFDPRTGRWVVKSWDGSVAGVDDGETRSFEDLSAPSTAALAANVAGRGRMTGNDAGGGGASEGGVGGGDDVRRRASASAQEGHPRVSLPPPPTVPFAIIDEVSPDSPASLAGLCEGDVILQFGPVDASNHRSFRSIAELVPAAAGEGKSIRVSVRRTTKELGGVVEVIKTEVAELRPRAWSGRGLLGCHIRPYSE